MNRLVLLGTLTASLVGRAATSAAQPLPSEPGPVVSMEWLQQHLTDPRVHVVATGQRDQYDHAHIPGARFIDHMTTLGSGHHLLPADALTASLAKAGAADGARMVLYGDPMTMGWLFMAFASVGHAGDVSMLDGGIELWQAEGRVVSMVPPPVAEGRLSVRLAPDVVVDAAWVRSRLDSPPVRVLDVRTIGEWTSGHLPGATLVFWQDVFEDPRTLKFRSPDQLRALFTMVGVRPGQQIVTYCAVGMRASLMYWAAWTVGIPARVYVGSFEDWQQDSTNPVVR
jgi:thiosulfate/3-mercaptopyruvate sulfurtransferase